MSQVAAIEYGDDTQTQQQDLRSSGRGIKIGMSEASGQSADH